MRELEPFEASNKTEALTDIYKLGPKEFENFCDTLLHKEGYDIEKTSKRGADGGVDAPAESQDIAFHFTTAYNTNSKASEDARGSGYEQDILLTSRPNRSASDVDEVWDGYELARRVMDLKC